MGAVAVIGAISLAASIGTTAYGISQQNKAKKDADKLRKDKPNITNPYADLEVSTIGGEFQSRQGLLSQATQIDAISGAGGRANAFIPSVASSTARLNQQISADYDRQNKENQRLYAQGDQWVQQMNTQDYQMQMQGYGNQYAAGQQTMMSGINNAVQTGNSLAYTNSMTGNNNNAVGQSSDPIRNNPFNNIDISANWTPRTTGSYFTL